MKNNRVTTKGYIYSTVLMILFHNGGLDENIPNSLTVAIACNLR